MYWRNCGAWRMRSWSPALGMSNLLRSTLGSIAFLVYLKMSYECPDPENTAKNIVTFSCSRHRKNGASRNNSTTHCEWNLKCETTCLLASLSITKLQSLVTDCVYLQKETKGSTSCYFTTKCLQTRTLNITSDIRVVAQRTLHCIIINIYWYIFLPSSAECVKLTRNAVNPCKHPAMMGNSGFLILDVICTKETVTIDLFLLSGKKTIPSKWAVQSKI